MTTQGLKVWVNVKNQIYPATVTTVNSNDISFTTEYGEVSI